MVGSKCIKGLKDILIVHFSMRRENQTIVDKSP